MKRGALAALLLSACPAPASAQEPHPEDARELAPPRVLSLPDIRVPPGLDLPPSGRVEVEVVIDRSGRATVVSADIGGELLDLVEEALEEALFAPATRGGEPIEARVRVSLTLAAVSGESGSSGGEGAPEAAGESPRPTLEQAPPELEFGAVARVRRPAALGGIRLSLAEVREIPGAFGDPMRALDTLPGTVPQTNGLPYAFVRGAPPSGSSYSYDGIRLPGLFHLLGGPGYVHPTLIGPITTFRGVAPARYGRRVGAVVVGEGPEEGDPERLGGELELRALDVNGVARAPLGGGTIAAGGRYGYPGPIVSALVPELDAAYWDWQLRLDLPVSGRDRVQLVLLGVYDSLETEDFGEPDATPERIEILFHRAEARYLHRAGRTELGVAFGAGHDDSSMNAADVRVLSMRLGPKLWVEHRGRDGTRLRVGGDLDAVVADVDGFDGSDLPADEGAQLDNAAYADAATQLASGLYVELGLAPTPELGLEAGIRGDLFLVAGEVEQAVEPRLQLVWHATPWLDLELGGGIAHQQAVFFLPLPGLSQLALDRGLQRALQLELGVGIDLPAGVRVEADLFLHRYDDLLLFELFDVLDCPAGMPSGSPLSCTNEVGIPRAEAMVGGGEIFARFAPSRRVLGWASYTVAWAEAEADNGAAFTPSFDVRHVVNWVGLVDLGGGFRVGLRAHGRTGRSASEIVGDPARYHEQRLPPFFRLDAQVSYRWATSWGHMQVTAEWFNTTLAREPIDIDCGGGDPPCGVEYGPALFYPNAGVRAEL